MLEIFVNPADVDEISIEISKHRLRQHIAKILAKIPAYKSSLVENIQECLEAELS